MEELDLSSMSLNELRAIAKENGLKNTAKYRKQELIDLLTEKFSSDENTEEKGSKEEKGNKESDEKKTSKKTNKSKSDENIDRDLTTSKSKTIKNITPENESPEKMSPEKLSSDIKTKDIKTKEKKIESAASYVSGEKIQIRDNSDTRARIESTNKFLTSTGVELVEKITKKESQENIKGENKYPQRENKTEEEDEVKTFPADTTDVFGVLEIQESNSFGFLRGSNYLTTPDDTYVSPAQIRRFRLKTGDFIRGKSRPGREGEKFRALIYVDSVNEETPDKAMRRPNFDTLTPVYPNERLHLEIPSENDLTTRIMDILCPIGKGQRGLIVAPPKAGKTTMLKRIAKNLVINNEGIKLIVLLIDERPEEVTDMKESVDGEVIYSTFDEEPSHHAKVAEMVLERAKRMVEQGQDVVILLDSLTRLSRAYNLTVTPSGRTLSGGLDPASLIMPKKFFGAARNIRKGGSLTILATALIDTGSRMDDMVFEEFKGTGNMEVHLDRKLQERRIFPAIDIFKSGTRKEELLLSSEELEISRKIRRLLYRGNDTAKVTEELISIMDNTEDNEHFMDAIKQLIKE